MPGSKPKDSRRWKGKRLPELIELELPADAQPSTNAAGLAAKRRGGNSSSTPHEPATANTTVDAILSAVTALAAVKPKPPTFSHDARRLAAAAAALAPDALPAQVVSLATAFAAIRCFDSWLLSAIVAASREVLPGLTLSGLAELLEAFAAAGALHRVVVAM